MLAHMSWNKITETAPRNIHHYDIYCDGACSVNPGPGGSAFCVLEHETSDTEVSDSYWCYMPDVTNNIMELVGVYGALSYIDKIGTGSHYTIYCDSSYVVNGVNTYMLKWSVNGWQTSTKAPVKNCVLWKQIHTLWNRVRQHHTVDLVWVRGHNGNVVNEYVDTVAVEAYRINIGK